MARALVTCALAIVGLAGCVEREFIATSSPSGALVTANGHEVGRTPMGREFQWYGYYDTTVRMDGYEPQRQVTSVVAPPWLWFPFDLVMELLPFTIRDEHKAEFTLEPTTPEQLDPAGMVSRGRELQTQLESGTTTVTKTPTTRVTGK
jgi:hypothetical protein